MIWSIAWLLLTGGLYLDAQLQRGPCEFSGLRVSPVQAASRQDDAAPEVGFNPCFMWRETYWWEKLLALSWLFAGVGLLLSVIRDMVRWGKRRRDLRVRGVQERREAGVHVE